MTNIFMLPNNSSPEREAAAQCIERNFQKVVDFIQWSQLEQVRLGRFEQLLLKQIKIPKIELENNISVLKLDRQMYRCLMQIPEQINHNLTLFASKDYDEYQEQLQTKAFEKLNLFLRTSPERIKQLCYLLIVLHFASRNMGEYNKILIYYEKLKSLSKKIEDESTYLFLKQKVLTIMSIISIKFSRIIDMNSTVRLSIKLRQAYEEKHFGKDRNSGKISLQSKELLENISQSSNPTYSSNKFFNYHQQYMYFKVLTMLLKQKLIHALFYNLKVFNQGSNLKKQQKQTWQQLPRDPATQKKLLLDLCQLQVLIQSYILQAKGQKGQLIKIEIAAFVETLEQKFRLCEQAIERLTLLQLQASLIQEIKINKESQEQSKSALTNQFEKIIFPLKTHNLRSTSLQKKDESSKQELKKRAFSSSSLIRKRVAFKQELERNFFAKNNLMLSSKNKSQSTKAFLRVRSKSKVMGEILATTFENAKNALRQIQFQIKNNQQFESQKVQSKLSKLKKRKKDKKAIYQNLNSHNLVSISLSKTSLLNEIAFLYNGAEVFNPIKAIQQSKKCIIQHKVVHKDSLLTQVFQHHLSCFKIMESSEKLPKLEFIRYVDGRPCSIVTMIKQVEKNYRVKVGIHSKQQLTYEIILPKSNNIYPGRYQTIWPTIKYLLTKKLLFSPLIKQYEYQLMQASHDEKQKQKQKQVRIQVKQKVIKEIFGSIQQSQFHEICSTINLITNFLNLIMYSSLRVTGRRVQLSSMSFSQNQKGQLNNNSKFSHGKLEENRFDSTKAVSSTQRKNLRQLQGLIRSHQYEIPFGRFIVQKNAQKIGPFMRFSQNYYLAEIYFLSEKSNNEEISLRIKIYFLSNRTKILEKSEKQQKKLQQITEEILVFNRATLREYRVQLDQLFYNVKKAVDGRRIQKNLQQKMLQICWKFYSFAEYFVTPSVMYINFQQIMLFRNLEIDLNSMPVCTTHVKPMNYIKVEENSLLKFFNSALEEEAEVEGENQANAFRGEKAYKIMKRPNIVTTSSFSLFPDCSNRLTKTFWNMGKGKVLKKSTGTYRRILQNQKLKYLIQTNFMVYNSCTKSWVAQIILSQHQKLRKYKIYISKEDLGIFGDKFINFEQAILELQKISRLFKVCSFFRMKKLIIDASLHDVCNFTIDYTKNNSLYKSESDKESVKTSSPFIKLRSVYHKNIHQIQYLDGDQLKRQRSYFNGNDKNLLQGGPQKRNSANLNTYRYTYQNSTQSCISKGNERFGNILSIFEEYELFICTVPIKFPILSLSSSLSPQAKTNQEHQQKKELKHCYMYLSLKMIDFPIQLARLQVDRIVQLEIMPTNSQYSLIAHFKQTQLQDMIQRSKKIEPEIFKKIYSYHAAPQQKQQNFDHLRQGRRGNKKKLKTRSKIEKISFLVTPNDIQNHETNLCQISPQKKKGKTYQSISKQQRQQEKDKSHSKLIANQPKMKEVLYQMKSFLNTGKIAFEKANTQKKIQPLVKCSQCEQNESFAYFYGINFENIPKISLQFRLYHSFHEGKKQIFDIYLHANKIVNTLNNIGVGLEVDVNDIFNDDHLQLVRFRKCKKDQKNFLPTEMNIRISHAQRNQNNEQIEKVETYAQGIHSSFSGTMGQSDQIMRELIGQQIGCFKLLQLIRQYRLEHIDPYCQLKPQLYTKNTISLVKLTKYVIQNYLIRKNLRKNYSSL